MSYSKQEMLEKLIEFKDEHGCFPKRKDLVNGMPSKTTLYRVFGGLDKATQQAGLYEKGDLIFEDVEDNIRLKKSMKKQRGFPCAFCGNYTTNPIEYYSSMISNITSGSIKVLNFSSSPKHTNGALDIVLAVFGCNNSYVRGELDQAGYIDQFDERAKIMAPILNLAMDGKNRCYKCGKYKDDWEMTIDCVSPHKHENICEDCFTKKK